jgi:hypothetical protein
MSSPEFVATPEQLEARWVDSEYGGVLFLISLGLFFELYGDFSQPVEPGIELPIWDFVALLGEEFVGRELRRDPLWPLLAELAGRQPGEEPGLHYQPPADWRMPPSWLKPFAAGNHWEWSGRQSRLQIRHPAGFVVADVAVSERNSIYRLAAELAPYRVAGLCTDAARRAPLARAGRSSGLQNNDLSLKERAGMRAGLFQHPVRRSAIRWHALQCWCGWLLPYVHARLAAALGVTAEEVGKLLCACPARLRVTATHLDAHFALANLPIEVRLAGLDRNPGWIPAAGRYIQFHFD